MTVCDNRKPEDFLFGQLKCGETFYDPYEEIHAMKIPPCTDEDGDCNAVSLTNGALLYYDSEDKIIKTKSRVEVYT